MARPDSPRRRGLRRTRRVLATAAGILFVATGVATVRVLSAGASPLPAATLVYAASVAFGLSEMVKLRERVLFRPSGPPPAASPWRWWAPRLVMVLAVSTLPAVLLLGGLTRR